MLDKMIALQFQGKDPYENHTTTGNFKYDEMKRKSTEFVKFAAESIHQSRFIAYAQVPQNFFLQ